MSCFGKGIRRTPSKVADESDSPDVIYQRILDIQDSKTFLQEAKHLMEERTRDTTLAFRNFHKFVKHGRDGKARKTELYLTLGHRGIAWRRSGWFIFHKRRYVDMSHVQGIEE